MDRAFFICGLFCLMAASFLQGSSCRSGNLFVKPKIDNIMYDVLGLLSGCAAVALAIF